MKVKFIFEELSGGRTEEVVELPNDFEDDDIQKDYEIWLNEKISDRTGWWIQE